MPSDDPQISNLWESQPVARIEIRLEELQRTAQKFEKRVFWRNMREYCAAVAVVAAYAYFIWRSPTALIRAGCGLVIAATLLVVWTLHRRGFSQSVPVELALRPCAEFHRRELERQRDLLRSVRTWYLLPFVPGIAVLIAGRYFRMMQLPHAPGHAQVVRFGIAAAVIALVFLGVDRLNHRAAARLQREIDGLDAIAGE